MKKTKIKDLDISIRCYNFLKINSITDLIELSKIEENDLYSKKGFNKFLLKEITEIMLQKNIYFKN